MKCIVYDLESVGDRYDRVVVLELFRKKNPIFFIVIHPVEATPPNIDDNPAVSR